MNRNSERIPLPVEGPASGTSVNLYGGYGGRDLAAGNFQFITITSCG